MPSRGCAGHRHHRTHIAKSNVTSRLVMMSTDALHTLTQPRRRRRERFLQRRKPGDRITRRSLGDDQGCRHAQPAWQMPSSACFWRLRPCEAERAWLTMPTVRAPHPLRLREDRFAAPVPVRPPIRRIKTRISALQAPPAIGRRFLPPPFLVRITGLPTGSKPRVNFWPNCTASGPRRAGRRLSIRWLRTW